METKRSLGAWEPQHLPRREQTTRCVDLRRGPGEIG